MKTPEEIRVDEVLEAYEDKFGERVPMGFGGVTFRNNAQLIEKVQRAIDTDTPFSAPEHQDGCVY